MADSPEIQFLLVDDHALLRRGLRELLAEEFPRAEFDEVGSGQDAIERIKQVTFSLVILDLSMPGRDGLDVLKAALELAPKLRVLVLSGHAEEQYAIRALRAGSVGYITKDSAPEELCQAVRKVLAGGKYVSPSLAETLATNLTTDAGRSLHESLSDRELQVLRMLAFGKSVKEIGIMLALSEKTISTYRTRVLAKMNLKTSADLMRYALRAGLVD